MASTTNKSIALTAALLALFASAFAADVPKGSGEKAIAANDTVQCYNVHDCKGNSDCKTVEHACKGHGFKAKTAVDCLKGNGVIGDVKA